MEGKFRSRVGCEGALRRKSGGEDGIETQQSSGGIFYSDKLEMQHAKRFEIGFVPRSEHCDLCFSRVSIIP